jgi:predicted Ser/Thr protein kinase
MDANEIRLRLIEAAAKFPTTHVDGYAAGVVDTAVRWLAWVERDGSTKDVDPRKVLGLPPKK